MKDDTELPPPGDDALAGTMHSAMPAGEHTRSWQVPEGERYTFLQQLGLGAQGEVFRAEDVVLGREVALKVLRAADPEAPLDPSSVSRFASEARLMAQIGHPNIIPIYDVGRLKDGRPFYTMPLLPQRTLSDMLAAMQQGQERAHLVRLMRLFTNACLGVHAAHEAGVVHRDLKPANMILGPNDELLVADFGLARLFKHDVVRPGGLSKLTAPGAAVGTPRYMSPQQVAGSPVGPPTDIYSLGCILYQLLTGNVPIRKDTMPEQLIAVMNEIPADPRDKDPSLPQDLCDLALRCLQKDPHQRPQTAKELIEVVDGWLEGRFDDERRREEHERRLAEAREHRTLAASLERSFLRTATELRTRRRDTPDHAPLSEKELLWLLEEDLEQLVQQHDDAEHHAALALEAALRAMPESRRARDELVDLHLGRRERHLKTGRAGLARREMSKAIAIGGDTVRARLFDVAHIDIDCAEPLDVELFEPARGRLGVVPIGPIEEHAADLSPGSYRLVWRRASKPPSAESAVYLPLRVEGSDRVRLTFDPTLADALPAGMTLIHGGPALLGGDDDVVLRERMSAVFAPTFAIGRRPVSCADYLGFLRAQPDAEAALLRAPRASADSPYWKLRSGKVVIPAADADGDVWLPEYPVFAISALDAEAYAAWAGARDRVTYRLPTDVEWERAARGADGRLYPWGDRFDPALCKMRVSREGQPRPEAIGAFETDVSPFGVIDLAGGVADWTSTPYLDDPEHRCVKGGAWSARAHRSLASFRGSMLESHISADLGFRLAMDV